VGAELFRADGQTRRCAFRNFANRPKNKYTQNSRVHSCGGSYFFAVELTTLTQFKHSREYRFIGSVLNDGLEGKWAERVVARLWHFTAYRPTWKNRGSPQKNQDIQFSGRDLNPDHPGYELLYSDVRQTAFHRLITKAHEK
jgi:hypothetical protein